MPSASLPGASPELAPNDGAQSTNELPQPPALPALCEEDYPDVLNWYKSQYKDAKKLGGEKGVALGKFSFLVDRDGNELGHNVKKKISAFFKTLCNTLFYYRENLVTWMAKTARASTYVRNSLCSEFKIFRYGEGCWKADQYAMLKYPDWVANTGNAGILQRKHPSINTANHQNLPKTQRKRCADEHEDDVCRKVKKERQDPRASIQSPLSSSSAKEDIQWF
ncbi:hypothetical protein CPC08DRAFT_771304 [Agrocybe pediades]|nr:hypothetical protein CPC08DRAFT_771304 [Agrocybe pediades]